MRQQCAGRKDNCPRRALPVRFDVLIRLEYRRDEDDPPTTAHAEIACHAVLHVPEYRGPACSVAGEHFLFCLASRGARA